MAESVLHLLGPSTGGIRRHVAALADALDRRGWDATVAGPRGVMAGLRRQDVELHVGRAPLALLRARRQLAAVAGRVDVVHSHGLTAGWLALLTAECRPLVVTVHNLVMHDIAGGRAVLDRRLETLLCRRADAVIATSTEMAADLADRAPGTMVVPIPPISAITAAAADRRQVRAALDIAAEVPLVVTAARLHPQKDHATFLEAVRTARKEVPTLRALVVGGGPLADDLRRLAAEMGLSGVATFCGGRDDAPDLIAAADVLVVSSRWESGPLVVREALELGTPVVSTRVGFVPEVLGASPVPPVPVGDHAGLASGIVAVLQSSELARAVVDAGREGAARILDPDRLVGEVEAVYRRVLAARG